MNTDARTGAPAIDLRTNGDDFDIYANNSGTLTAVRLSRPCARAPTAPMLPITIVNSGDINSIVTARPLEFSVPRGLLRCICAGSYSPIVITNSGTVSATTTANGVFAINASARDGANSSVTINNSGDLLAVGQTYAYGITARSTGGDNSPVSITNSGAIVSSASSGRALGINAYTEYANSSITITNSGGLKASSSGSAYAIRAENAGTDSPISIVNSGDLTASSTSASAFGIYGRTRNSSSLSIENTADIKATAVGGNVTGIEGKSADSSPINITNSGDITATTSFANADGIRATSGNSSPLSVDNSGKLTVATITGSAYGIRAQSGSSSPVTINNSGDMKVTATGASANGILGSSNGSNSAVEITNTAKIIVNGASANGIVASALGSHALGSGSTVSIVNSAELIVTGTNGAAGISATGVSDIIINNSADIHATSSQARADGIFIRSFGNNAPTEVVNSGDIRASGKTIAFGIAASQFGANRPLTIHNSGSVFAEGPSNAQAGYVAGISVYSQGSPTTIINSGDIGASSQLAIVVKNGPADIFNTGTIDGFVWLDADDTFINQAGGTFEARGTSDFDKYGTGGTDLFVNQAGATVHATGDTRFVNLETFKNQGLISTVDGATGDSFTISNTVGGKDLNFVASGNSTLAVDAFLGGPSNSSSDTFTIEGNVSGVTTVEINNTNAGPGVYNPTGIKLVTVTGKTPNSNAFQLAKPIDTGFFDYDLFFTPTGSGFWSLKSYPGAGAQLLAAAPHRGAGHLAPDLVDLVRPHGGFARAAERWRRTCRL